MAIELKELKPCPFCGRPAVIREEENEHLPSTYEVICLNENCGCIGGWDYDMIKAVNIWNTRPLEDTLRAENARLREALEWIKDACAVDDFRRFPGLEAIYVAARKALEDVDNGRREEVSS